MNRGFPVFKITNLKVTDTTSKVRRFWISVDTAQNSMLTNTYILHTEDNELKNRGYAGR